MIYREVKFQTNGGLLDAVLDGREIYKQCTNIKLTRNESLSGLTWDDGVKHPLADGCLKLVFREKLKTKKVQFQTVGALLDYIVGGDIVFDSAGEEIILYDNSLIWKDSAVVINFKIDISKAWFIVEDK